jgi:hypothetical protein
MDRFKIECADLGDLFKIKIRHENVGFSADWFLDRFEVADDRKNYKFASVGFRILKRTKKSQEHYSKKISNRRDLYFITTENAVTLRINLFKFNYVEFVCNRSSHPGYLCYVLCHKTCYEL